MFVVKTYYTGVQDAVVAVVFMATITCLYARPKGAKDWQVAGVGGAAAWLLSPLGVEGGLEVIGESGNILLFFFGLMLLAAGAEACGLYALASRLIQRAGGGRRELVAVLAMGTGVTVILSNDATPLVLTPAIFAAGRARGHEPRDAAFGAAFISNGASLVLPVSNPVNLLFYERFHLSFAEYATLVMPAAIVATAAIWVALLVRKAEVLPRIAQAGPQETTPETRPGLQRAGAILVAVMAPVYVVGAIAEVPLGLISVGGGLAMMALLVAGGAFHARQYRKHISPGLFPFICGLLLLVEAATSAGLLGPVADLFSTLDDQPAIVAITGAALLATTLANLMNNWPSALLIAATIGATGEPSNALLAGALIGSTIGANLTMVGALSTVFWLTLARNEGARYSPPMYVRRAFLPTVLAVGAACLVAALSV